MKCEKCKSETNHANSLNVNDKRLCILCAYQSFPEDSPGRVQLAKYYEEIKNEMR